MLREQSYLYLSATRTRMAMRTPIECSFLDHVIFLSVATASSVRSGVIVNNLPPDIIHW